jgi:hypothetical protein
MSDTTDLVNDDSPEDDCQDRPCPHHIIKSWHKKEKKKDKMDKEEKEDKHQKQISDIYIKYSDAVKNACHEFNTALDAAMRSYYDSM